MNVSNRETSLFRKSLLGIRVTPFEQEPLFKTDEWRIYDAGIVLILPPEDRIRNKNYQIERGDQEKILVRIFLSFDKTFINRTKYYFLGKNTDAEIALYLTLSLLLKLDYRLSPDHELLPFAF